MCKCTEMWESNAFSRRHKTDWGYKLRSGQKWRKEVHLQRAMYIMLGNLGFMLKVSFLSFSPIHDHISCQRRCKKSPTVLSLSTLAFSFLDYSQGGIPSYSLETLSLPHPSMGCVLTRLLLSCNLHFCQTHPTDQACDNCLPLWVVSSWRPESMAHLSWCIRAPCPMLCT